MPEALAGLSAPAPQAPAGDQAQQQAPAATPENVATPADATQAPDDGKNGSTEAAKTVSMSQEEFDKRIQAEKAKAEARAERRALKAYRETLERIVPPQPGQQSTPPQAADEKPRAEQFKSVEDYVEAVTDWKLKQRDVETTQAKQQEQARTLSEKTERIYVEAQKIDGFDREAFDELPLTRQIAEALVESDAPAKLMAYMAGNPEEVARIAGLSPARQAAEIGKLEARLAAAPKPSAAPPPIKPIGTRGSASPGDLSKASMDDYIEQRRKQGARWAR